MRNLLKPRSILLIDDDEEDAEIFEAAIAEVSTEIHYTYEHDARQALSKLKAKQLTPEVIFLDLNMPIMNGQSFLLEVKKDAELSTIPIIIFSTSKHETTVSLMRELGAANFITKPSSIDRLIEILTPIFT